MYKKSIHYTSYEQSPLNRFRQFPQVLLLASKGLQSSYENILKFKTLSGRGALRMTVKSDWIPNK